MANIYDVASAIQQPNIVGNFQQGQQFAQQQQANMLRLQQAQQQQADQSQLRQLAPQVISGDPNAFAQAAAIDPQAAQGYQNAGDMQLRRLKGAMDFIDQQKTPQAKEIAYQQVRPFLSRFGQDAPATFAEAEPKMEAARAQIAQLGGQQAGLINVPVGGAIFDPNTGQPVFQNKAGIKPQIIQTADGFAMVTPDGRAVPISYGGAQSSQQNTGQAITPSSPSVPNAADMANALLKNGSTPEQAISAVNASMGGLGKFDLALDPSTNQFRDVSNGSEKFPQGQLQAPPKGNAVIMLSPSDVKGLGFPDGTVAQRDSQGRVTVLYKPGQDSSTVLAPGDPTKTGEAYLASLPASMRGLVKAIANGDQAPPSSSSRSPEAQAILQAVYTYDPSASATNLPSRVATRKSFTSGKDAQNMTALSQLAIHLDHLDGQIGNVSGLSAPGFVNTAINAVTDRFTGKVTSFESSANAVAHELRSVFANAGGGTEAELEKNLDALKSSKSETQLKAAIQNIAQLVQGRFAILQDKYTQGMGRTEDPFQAKYPGAESTIMRLAAGFNSQGGQSQPAQATQAPAQGKVLKFNPATGMIE